MLYIISVTGKTDPNFPRASESIQHGNLKTANKKILGVTFESKEQCAKLFLRTFLQPKPKNGFHGLGFCCVSDSINV